jgi:AcrR family transcriptional regulator
MTFYYHFSDIYDLLDWICEADVAKVLEGKNTYETWQEGFLNILLLVRENRQIVVNLCHSVSLERMELFLHKLIYDLIIDVVEEKAEGMVVRDEDKRYIADFYKYAIVGIMLNWIRNDMKDDPNQIVNSFYILISSNIPLALSYYRVDKTN